ncbi:MAG: DUF1223 domain-containing protein [Maricaulaceae bacterium]|nr:DUF1223 domain-containing protein [Maricaulaceae bacterium]
MIRWLAALGFLFSAASAAADDHADSPAVLVELFTSQGCSMCPEANRLLGEIGAQDGVLALGFGVGYWDVYGWRDTYARPEFAARQRAYKHALGTPRVYTPQFVINAAADAPGGDPERVSEAVASAEPAVLAQFRIMRLPGGAYRIQYHGEAPGDGPADVWLVSYEPGWRSVNITEGANAGLRMRLYNPVLALIHVQEWEGGEGVVTAALPRGAAGAVIIQRRNGGPVIAMARFARDGDPPPAYVRLGID